jgi:hypothetical protein
MKFNSTQTKQFGDENQDYFTPDRRKAKPIPIAYYPNSAFIRRKWKKEGLMIYNVY